MPSACFFLHAAAFAGIHQHVGAPPHPILLVGLSKSSACPRVLRSWDADGPGLTHHSCAPGDRNGTMKDVSPGIGRGRKVAFFLHWLLLQVTKDKDLAVPALRS